MGDYMKRIKTVFNSVIFIFALSVSIVAVTYILSPKIPSFYKEKKLDVVFFGTSQSYCSFDPKVFDEYGLKTYNRGRQQQTMNYTYYYVKDALDSCDIDVVVVEIFGMFYEEGDDRFADKDIRDSTLNEMKYGKAKLQAIIKCVPRSEQISYLFPLDKYHGRWEEWNNESLKEILEPYYEEEDRGFVRKTEQVMCTDDYWSIAFSEVRRDVNEKNLESLEKIYELCQKRGVKLVLVKAPLPCYDRVIEETNTIQDWADERGIELINYMRLQDVLEMNFYTDSLDGGVHLNEIGAKRVSKHLAQHLKEHYFDHN